MAASINVIQKYVHYTFDCREMERTRQSKWVKVYELHVVVLTVTYDFVNITTVYVEQILSHTNSICLIPKDCLTILKQFGT